MTVSVSRFLSADELAIEHGVLMRQIGGLQRRCGEMLQASARREDALQVENLRLRAELVLLRTRVYWGMGVASAVRRPPPSRSAASRVADCGAREAQAVICQTGCVGHAHPWLQADGQCRLSGQTCARQDMTEQQD